MLIARISAIAIAMTMTPTPTISNHTYNLNTVVIDTNLLTDTVYCMDDTGNVWSFYGENWFIGDKCQLQMENNGTMEIEDDIILLITYTE